MQSIKVTPENVAMVFGHIKKAMDGKTEFSTRHFYTRSRKNHSGC